MIIDTPIWRNADLIRIIPITRADLNQAISRNDFRPENTPKPGQARWYSWRDVVAIAVAQDLRRLGFGPSIAFGQVQEHLSPFLRGSIDAPDDCAGVLWLIRPSDDHFNIETTCEFLRHTEYDELLITPNRSACIIVNVGRISARVLNDLQATETAKVHREELQITGPVM
ncbi:hypothetical protein [Roseinatronobacter bogoriensis]|uniref:HTH merR-type domain-containing protein n=1 Tax=Roseinatronobacter bogoriensis subsp. barguzinensis TaxID=441209 RepID=A0A2K8KEK5_9RHOB|nr:hypothetical protein [Rhodobaca]ATX64580.1 hypothetical protein BG454_00980 [Rhodobaca barguzinensis]MBB4209767.1 hypothetical protein [Rhodobaca bogoriensis DSM 18756]TDW33683.1 hypothetical protein LY39_03516 [Rhodobaca barguzinensis]TDY66153.1 hypothetical protein EV660_1136 [Rhodobaca bogoriensis DSM 18756]